LKTVLTIYLISAALILGLTVIPVDYSSSDTNMEFAMFDGAIGQVMDVPVHTDNITEYCGEEAAACAHLIPGESAEIYLPEKTSVVEMYLNCGHEKQHVNHPRLGHNETNNLWERTYEYENSIGWHPQCVDLALPF